MNRMEPERYTVNGKGSFTFKDAIRVGTEIHRRTGVFVEIKLKG